LFLPYRLKKANKKRVCHSFTSTLIYGAALQGALVRMTNVMFFFGFSWVVEGPKFQNASTNQFLFLLCLFDQEVKTMLNILQAIAAVMTIIMFLAWVFKNVR
jgi:hypothetical protein